MQLLTQHSYGRNKAFDVTKKLELQNKGGGNVRNALRVSLLSNILVLSRILTQSNTSLITISPQIDKNLASIHQSLSYLIWYQNFRIKNCRWNVYLYIDLLSSIIILQRHKVARCTVEWEARQWREYLRCITGRYWWWKRETQSTHGRGP